MEWRDPTLADPELLSEATSTFLHISLQDQHGAPATSSSPQRTSFDLHPRGRRRSLEGLRAPPGFHGASSRSRQELEEGTSRVVHVPQDRGAPRLGNGAKDGDLISHPFAQSTQLLRRATSFQTLEVLVDAEDEDQDEDEFSSDEEPFRLRPPSIASSVVSHPSARVGVRIEDRSDEVSKCFARDVTIRGFHAVGGEKQGGFVVFDCEVKTKEGTTIRTLKRYSAFVRLRNDLNRTFPRLKHLIPRLPPKSSLAKFRPSFLERRRQQLCFWLSTVLLHPQLGGSGIVRAWICEP